MESIGVRELRQNASKYLARVEAGETLEVTNHGRTVALLAPPPKDHVQWLVDTGQLIPAVGDGDLLDEPPCDYGIDASARLAAIREHER